MQTEDPLLADQEGSDQDEDYEMPEQQQQWDEDENMVSKEATVEVPEPTVEEEGEAE